MIRNISWRIFSDFFMPSRLVEYKELLISALECKYKVISVEQFCEIFINKKGNSNSRYLVMRHDVDSNINAAKKMFEIEKKLGVHSSYYFRLSTICVPFMREVYEYGSEASYHYEEIATYAKQNHIKDPQKIYFKMEDIQELFSRNLNNLRKATNIPMKIVASHGDFVNRFLKVFNYELLKDKQFRVENDIKLEVYDEAIMKFVTDRFSDTGHPVYWKPHSPEKAIKDNSPVIYILTHPGHWEVNVKENLKNNFKRLYEGIKYKVKA